MQFCKALSLGINLAGLLSFISQPDYDPILAKINYE